MRIPIPAFTWVDFNFTIENSLAIFYFLIMVLFYCTFTYWAKRKGDKDYTWWIGIVLSFFWFVFVPLFLGDAFKKGKRK
jgi:quinol-cytochrome oxidoreductase complex cytochrome b subunit